MFRAPASSSTQVPCSQYSDITLRFAAKNKIPKHHVTAMCRHAKHIEAANTVQTTPSLGRTQPAPASHTSCPFTRKSTMFRAAASSLTQVPCNIHAASTMILQCVLQPKIPKHHVTVMCRHAKHIEAAITVRTTPSLGRTQPAPASHTSCPFARKSTMFLSAASSPTQVPCNIHAASTMILQCVLQPKIPKHHVTVMCRHAKHIEAAITVRTIPSLGRTQPAPASHTSCPFARKSTMFLSAASSPTQVPCNIHAASTMILQCVLQPKIPRHNATAMGRRTRNTLKQPLQCSSTSFLGCRRGDDRVVVRRQGLSVPCWLQPFDII